LKDEVIQYLTDDVL